MLKYVDQKLQTDEIVSEAVNQNGYYLQFVKPELQTSELYLKAVKRNGMVISFIIGQREKEYKILKAINNDQRSYLKDFYPKLWIYYEILLEAVKQNAYALPDARNCVGSS